MIDEQQTIDRAKKWAKVGYGVIILAIAVLGLIFYWSNQASPLIIQNNPNPVQPTTVLSERYVTLSTKYCKSSNIKGIVHPSLVSDKTVLPLPAFEEKQPKGCATISFPYPVPLQTVKDTYHYHFVDTYQINPIKTVTTIWDSQDIIIQGTPTTNGAQ